MMRTTVVALAVAGCASGQNYGPADAPAAQSPDAKVFRDGQIEPQLDAPPQMHDAAVVPIDAPPDACVPVVTELLANPVFDLTPPGTGWQQTPIDPGYPPITSDGPFAAHTAPYKVWTGGFAAPNLGQTVTDVVYQDFAVPAATTQLVITGYYTVGTNEDPAATFPYDTGELALLQTNGTPIEGVLALSNLTTVGTWTAFSHTFAGNLSGQTVRVRMTSSNDDSFATNFFYDTLSVKATHGCP